MIDRKPTLTVVTLLIGAICFSVGYNVYLYNRLKNTDTDNHFLRCGTNEFEFEKIKEEIKRLELNPPKDFSVLKN